MQSISRADEFDSLPSPLPYVTPVLVVENNNSTNVVRHDELTKPPIIPQNVLDQLKPDMDVARQRLIDGKTPCGSGTYKRKTMEKCMYQDVLVSLPLQCINSSLYSNLKGKHGDTAELKVVINPDVAFRNKVCVVYAMGIADQSGFEQEMSKYCEELQMPLIVPLLQMPNRWRTRVLPFIKKSASDRQLKSTT